MPPDTTKEHATVLIDPLKDFPGYALRRASVVAMAQLTQRLSELSLRPTDATVLLVIQANPGVTQSEIGRFLDIASANMTPLAARLDDRGLIARAPVDGRSHSLRLTEMGRQAARRAGKLMRAHEAALLAKLPVEQRDVLLKALNTLWSFGR